VSGPQWFCSDGDHQDKLSSYGAALREIGFPDCLSKDCVPTTMRRILISRFDDANERYKASNKSNRRSVRFSTCGGLQHVQRSTAFNRDQPQDVGE